MGVWGKYDWSEKKAHRNLENDIFFRGKFLTSEDELCIACARLFTETGNDPFQMIHIPNGGSRTAWEGRNFKRMGVRAGVPDYLMSNKEGKPVAWFEFKFGKNGLTEEQKRFQAWTGLPFVIIRTPEEFLKNLKELGL